MNHPTRDQKSEHERRVEDKLRRELGKTVLSALDDPTVEDISRNSDGWLWVKKQGQPWERLDELSDTQTENILRSVASSLQFTITPEQPYLDGNLVIDGSRIHGNIPPVTRRPSFTIRKFPSLTLRLDDYVEQAALSQEYYDAIIKEIKNRSNILIVGSTGSGKTVLTNACLNAIVELFPLDRYITIEDNSELKLTASNVEQLFTTFNRSLEDLVKETLRMRPDRIVVGEIRGSEALHLLEIWNTGHNGGLATAHSDSATPAAALCRMEMLVSRAEAKLGTGFIRRLIGSTVNVIVCIKNTQQGRKITSVTYVKGYNGNEYECQTI